jgi:O-antigen ligase
MLPLSTELQVTESLGLDFPDEPLLMLLTGFCLVKWIYKPADFPVSVLKSPVFMLIVLQVCWTVVTCFFSMNPLLSVKFLLAKSWYIIPFVLLFQVIIKGKSDLIKLGKLLLIPMLFVVIQALIRHAFYGYSFEGVKQTLYPFFRNHVNYSAMLVCLLAVLWAFQKLTPSTQPNYKWIIAGLVIGLIGLILSYSRGAWLAFIMGLIIFFVVKRRWMVQFWVLLIFSVVLVFSWLVFDHQYLQFAPDHDHTIFHTDFSEHLKATVTFKDVSNAERFYRWVAGIKMIAAKPVTGFGPNNFYQYYKAYASEEFKTWVSNNPDHSTVHNYFLLLALQQGIPGLMLFLVLLIILMLRLQNLYHRLHSVFYQEIAIAVPVILMMIITLIFLSDLIETDKIGSLYWLCAGITIWLENKLKEERLSLA